MEQHTQQPMFHGSGIDSGKWKNTAATFHRKISGSVKHGGQQQRKNQTWYKFLRQR